jgi:DeoR/GlpR family transcriptional regulator of sugar metabolism
MGNGVVLLADSSKFGYSAPMMVASLWSVAVLVTDDSISKEARRAVEDAGVALVSVPAGDHGEH